MLSSCGTGEDSWESLGQQGDQTKSILKKINPEYSLEGLMLKLTLQYLAWRSPWTEEPGGLYSMGLQRVRHDWATNIHQFSSVTQSCLTLWDPMDYSTPGFPVHHQLPELIQTHVHWVSDAIQPSHPLSSPSPPAFNLSQHQGLFKWVSSSHQVAKVLEFQLQHQSCQWVFRTDFL